MPNITTYENGSYQHRRGCKGSCTYCSYIKDKKIEEDGIKKDIKGEYSWDECNVLI